VRFYIYAGDARQASNLARAMDLGRHEWRSVHGVEQLIGKRGGTVLLYGTWKSRPNDEIMEVITRAKVNMMTVLLVDDRFYP
jgi:hypothetical protein